MYEKRSFFMNFDERNRPLVNFRHLICRLTCSTQGEESNTNFRTLQGAKWTLVNFRHLIRR